jgi:hypothetical protein
MNNCTISESVYDSVFGSVRKASWGPVRVHIHKSIIDLSLYWTWGLSERKSDSIIDFLDIAVTDYFKQND